MSFGRFCVYCRLGRNYMCSARFSVAARQASFMASAVGGVGVAHAGYVFGGSAKLYDY